MKKKPFVIILAIIMIIISCVFAACNGNPTDTTLPAPPSDLEPKPEPKPEPDPEPEPLPDPPPEEVYESEGIEFYSMFEYDEVLGDYEKVGYSVASVCRYSACRNNLHDELYNNLEIPNEYGGLPVIKIKSWGFSYNKHLNTVRIPDGVTTIGTNSFQASSVKKITMTDSVTILEWGAFVDCYNLYSIRLSDNIEGFSFDCFSWCDDLKVMNIPAKLKYMAPMAVPRDMDYLIMPELDKLDINIAYKFLTKSIVIPSCVEELIFDYDKFKPYYPEFQINFKGTEEQWESIISKLSEEQLEAIRKFKVNYNFEMEI